MNDNPFCVDSSIDARFLRILPNLREVNNNKVSQQNLHSGGWDLTQTTLQLGLAEREFIMRQMSSRIRLLYQYTTPLMQLKKRMIPFELSLQPIAPFTSALGTKLLY